MRMRDNFKIIAESKTRSLVLRPGFGPGSATREAAILGPSTKFDRTILPER